MLLSMNQGSNFLCYTPIINWLFSYHLTKTGSDNHECPKRYERISKMIIFC